MLNSQGIPIESLASFVSESGGERAILAGNITYGDRIPKTKIQADLAFTLKEKVQPTSDYIALAQRFFKEDSTVAIYSKQKFFAMVESKLGAIPRQ